ncbi:MAG: hypothetical protein U1F10_13560 [Burkholderiales bacterium]
MLVDVMPLYDCGKPVYKSKKEEGATTRGHLKIGEERIDKNNRVANCANVLSAADGLDTPMLAQLVDARLIYWVDRNFRLSGTENIEGVNYAQAWDVTVVR